MTPHDLAYRLGISVTRLLVELRLEGWYRGAHTALDPSTIEKVRAHFPDADRWTEPRRAPERSVPFGPEPRSSSLPFHIFSEDERRALSLLAIPNVTVDSPTAVSRLDLRKLREGLGLSLEEASAVTAERAGYLDDVERRGAPVDVTRRIMSAYGVHVAAMWASDALRLDAATFDS